MGYFHAKVNGEYRKFKHHPRHKPNSRSVALKKFKEGGGDYFRSEKLVPKDIVNIFESGYNMGYKDAIARIKDVGFVQGEGGKLNMKSTNGCGTQSKAKVSSRKS